MDKPSPTLISSLQAAAEMGLSRLVLAIGNFDGVHLGHRSLLREVTRLAAEAKATPAILTFSPHPLLVLGRQPPPSLCDECEQASLLGEAGIELILRWPFTTAFAATSAAEFITLLRSSPIPIHTIVIGADWRFGSSRQGSAQELAAMPDLPFRVHIAPMIGSSAVPQISSTLIRQLLLQGHADQAAELLGRPWSFTAPPAAGLGIAGSELHAPTINLDLAGRKLPLQGVYAARVTLNSAPLALPAVLNAGTAPSVPEKGGRLGIEIHLLELPPQGLPVQITCLHIEPRQRLRDELVFPSRAALAAQIQQDISHARRLLLG